MSEFATANAYDHLMKILLIGDSGSNKRQLLGRYLQDDELTDTTTLGLDYKLKDMVHKSKTIKLQLWDTAGQERFRSVTASYYRGAHGALLVFTLSKETSFLGLNYWLEEIKNNAPQRFQILLVATDPNVEGASVNLEIAHQFAREKNIELAVCSLDNQNEIDGTFLQLINKVMTGWEEGISGINASIQLSEVHHHHHHHREDRGCFC